jgi:hypothetical protein
MRALRVNADYELALFEGRAGPKIVNESVEFLALFLEERPLYSQKTYADCYLRHVEELTGRAPRITAAGPAENWWGSLADLSRERRLNSKEVILPFSAGTALVTAVDEFRPRPGTRYLLKSAHGMSGQNFLVWDEATPRVALAKLLDRCDRLVAEPLLDRRRDFSHYVLSPATVICYENLVDERFQYKGTLFSDLRAPDFPSLSFSGDVSAPVRERFLREFAELRAFVAGLGVAGGYGVDSFTYAAGAETRVRTISEINYRKTMGLVAWLLSNRFSAGDPWTMFFLARPPKKPDVFTYIRERTAGLPGLFYLSPGDTRFEVFLLTAPTAAVGRARLAELRALLPDCELPVDV